MPSATDGCVFNVLRYLLEMLWAFRQSVRVRDYEIPRNWQYEKCRKTKTAKYWEGAFGWIIRNIITYLHAKFHGKKTKFWVDVFLKRDFATGPRPGPVRRSEISFSAAATKRLIRKRRNFQGWEAVGQLWHTCKKNKENPMYMHDKLWFTTPPHFHIIEPPPESHFTVAT